jgi:hypothetical protein
MKLILIVIDTSRHRLKYFMDRTDVATIGIELYSLLGKYGEVDLGTCGASTSLL